MPATEHAPEHGTPEVTEQTKVHLVSGGKAVLPGGRCNFAGLGTVSVEVTG